MDGLQPLDFRALHAGTLVPGNLAAVSDGGAFARALAHAPLLSQSLRALEPRTAGETSTLDRLAGHLERIERARAEARRLPERVAAAYANGAGPSTIAISMHRQARLMAAYQLDVLWTAKIVGTTTASLKQLIAAS